MIINLTKNQTLIAIYKSRKLTANKNRYTYTTKTAWKCLGCLTDIFISFKQASIDSIFCSGCSTHNSRPSLVQAQYMRRLKEEQYKIINNDMTALMSARKLD